ncbi:hypothetical protein RRG08_007924 [Elysia crispata]|uniref:Uncharacterized protein n=1 Tax=Elysia crispata TaxID=231223 RepID=A0AAE0ZPY2_9GAST|nr:hypothetical protein RRG08_007924 [Elysia crispata]
MRYSEACTWSRVDDSHICYNEQFAFCSPPCMERRFELVENCEPLVLPQSFAQSSNVSIFVLSEQENE